MNFERFKQRMQAEGYTYTETEESDRSSSLYHEFEHEHGWFIVRDSDHDANCGWHVLLNLDIWDLEEWEFSFVAAILRLNIATYQNSNKRRVYHNPHHDIRGEYESVEVNAKPKPVCITSESLTEDIYWAAHRFDLLDCLNRIKTKYDPILHPIKRVMIGLDNPENLDNSARQFLVQLLRENVGKLTAENAFGRPGICEEYLKANEKQLININL